MKNNSVWRSGARIGLLFVAMCFVFGQPETCWAKKEKKKGKRAKVKSVEPQNPQTGQNYTLELPGGEKLELLWVDPGKFMMGSPPQEPERGTDETFHQVELTSGFWLGKMEVTQGQWEVIMGENPSNFSEAGKNAPVEKVSWDNVSQFCQKVTEQERGAKRLPVGYEYTFPTEAQWEYACRAGTNKALYTGDLTVEGERNSPELDPIAWYGGNSGVDYDGGYDTSGWKEKQIEHSNAGTHAVGLKQPNSWGFYDMIGNVYEWCADMYGPYPKGSAIDPEATAGNRKRVIRGGGWYSKAGKCRSANRNNYIPVFRSSSLGFRLALRKVQPVEKEAVAVPAVENGG